MPDGVVKLKKQETAEMKTNIYNSITKVTVFIFIHIVFVIKHPLRARRVGILPRKTHEGGGFNEEP